VNLFGRRAKNLRHGIRVSGSGPPNLMISGRCMPVRARNRGSRPKAEGVRRPARRRCRDRPDCMSAAAGL